MRARLLPLALFVSFAALPCASINTSDVGLMAYVYVGGSINLTIFTAMAYAGNASALFSPLGGSTVTNYTDGIVEFIGGHNVTSGFCAPLPYFNEDGLAVSERPGSACASSPRFGFAGDSNMHVMMSQATFCDVTAFADGCPSTGFNIRARVRADGWVLAYQAFRSVSGWPAGFLRWTAGGRGNTTGYVDDTLLGVVINRSLEVIRISGANATPLPAYTSTLSSYYHFEFTDASLMLVGTRSIPPGGYTPSSYAFSFNRGTYSIKHASVSMRARDSGTSYYVGGAADSNRFACISSGLGSGSDSSISSLATFTAQQNTTGPMASGCPSPGTSKFGNPFYSASINTSVFSIPASTWVNITHEDTEMKFALMLLLG